MTNLFIGQQIDAESLIFDPEKSWDRNLTRRYIIQVSGMLGKSTLKIEYTLDGEHWLPIEIITQSGKYPVRLPRRACVKAVLHNAGQDTDICVDIITKRSFLDFFNK